MASLRMLFIITMMMVAMTMMKCAIKEGVKKNSSHGICPLLDLKVNKPLLPLSLPFSIFDSKPSVKGGGGPPETPTAEAIRLDDKLNYSLYISSISYVCMFCMIRAPNRGSVK